MKYVKEVALGLITIGVVGTAAGASTFQGAQSLRGNFDSTERQEQANEIREAYEAGNTEKAQSLEEEYGFGTGMGSKMGHGKGENFGERGTPMMSDEVEAALESGDYDAFVTAHEGTPMADVSEERFQEMVEMHQAMESGDEETLQRIREERKAQHDAIRAAIEEGDYQAFVEAGGDDLRADLTEEQFKAIVEMHEAREAGDYEKAQEIHEEVFGEDRGFGMGMGHQGQEKGQGVGTGMGRGMGR